MRKNMFIKEYGKKLFFPESILTTRHALTCIIEICGMNITVYWLGNKLQQCVRLRSMEQHSTSYRESLCRVVVPNCIIVLHRLQHTDRRTGALILYYWGKSRHCPMLHAYAVIFGKFPPYGKSPSIGAGRVLSIAAVLSAVPHACPHRELYNAYGL